MSNRPQLFSGARGQFSITRAGVSTIFAFSTDVSVNVRHAVRPSFVIGDMNAIAIDTLSYDVDISVGRLVPINNSDPTKATIKSVGQPEIEPGADYGAAETQTSAIKTGMEISIASILVSDDIEISIIDRTTAKTLASIKGCRFSGRSASLNAQDVLQERLNFVGIYDAGYNGTSNTATLGYGLG